MCTIFEAIPLSHVALPVLQTSVSSFYVYRLHLCVLHTHTHMHQEHMI